MSKLNLKKVSNPLTPAPFGLGVSGNGNVQFKKDPLNILFETLVSTLYGKDSYYESANETVGRMKVALAQVVNDHGLKGAEYAGRVALFAREHMNIRTMPIVMVVELAKILQERNLQTKEQSPYKLRNLVRGVISRADELTDMFAYALTVFGETKKIPMGLKRGVADAFNKFDAYQFGKYNRKEGLTLKNLLRIVHPEPAAETNSEIFKKIMEETLESPYTWEVELSKNGQLPPDERKTDKQLWTELVTREGSGSLGYMAMLRNLRNMKEADIDDATWKLVAAKLSNPKAVEKSKQLPFGFINSYEVAKESGVPGIVLNALQTATELSLENMPKLGDRVWIIADCSGSMGMSDNYNSYGIGRRQTENSPIKVAAIFGAALVKAAKNSFQVKFTMFDDHAKHIDLNPRDSIFTLFEKIMARNAGGGTNLESAIDEKPKLGFEPDTVVVLSDMEVNRLQTGRNIDQVFKKDCVKVAINLASRDTTPLAEWKGWIQLAGWSPKIFQFVNFTREADSIVTLLYEGKIPLSGEAVKEQEAN